MAIAARTDRSGALRRRRKKTRDALHRRADMARYLLAVFQMFQQSARSFLCPQETIIYSILIGKKW